MGTVRSPYLHKDRPFNPAPYHSLFHVRIGASRLSAADHGIETPNPKSELSRIVGNGTFKSVRLLNRMTESLTPIIHHVMT